MTNNAGWIEPLKSSPAAANGYQSIGSEMTISPKPGEYVFGHLGRWQRLLDAASINDVVNLLHDSINLPTPSGKMAKISSLAQASKREAKEYIQEHTLIPFDCFCAGESLVEHGYLIPSALDHYSLTKYPTAAMLCPKCVVQDIAEHGLSYWRRDHQIPGHLWCKWHESQRLHVASADQPFSSLPQYWLVNGASHEHRFDEQLLHNPVYKRYLLACENMISQTRPVDSQMLKQAITVTAQSYGIATQPGGRIKKSLMCLSELAVNSTSADFSQLLFPTIDPRQLKQVRVGVDTIFANFPHGSTGIAIAIALLFPKLFPLDSLTWNSETLQDLCEEGASVAQQFIELHGDISSLEGRWKTDRFMTLRRVVSSTAAIVSQFENAAEKRALEAFMQGLSLDQASKKHCADVTLVEKLIWLQMTRPTESGSD